MKICLACRAENKDNNKYCNKCGTKFEISVAEPAPFPGAGEAMEPKEKAAFMNGYAFDDEFSSVTDDEKAPFTGNADYAAIDALKALENEGAAVIYTMSSADNAGSIADFENEETAVIDTMSNADSIAEFENEETVIIDGAGSTDSVADFENEETVMIGNADNAPVFESVEPAGDFNEVEEPPKAPNFNYAGEVPVYRDPQNDVEPETGYIDHLRRLKGLLDDGIINEWEYEQKKQQILGLYNEQGQK